MSSKTPKFKAPPPVTVEEPKVISDTEDEEVQRKKRAVSQNAGRSENILSGLQAMLKDRLGK